MALSGFSNSAHIDHGSGGRLDNIDAGAVAFWVYPTDNTARQVIQTKRSDALGLNAQSTPKNLQLQKSRNSGTAFLNVIADLANFAHYGINKWVFVIATWDINDVNNCTIHVGDLSNLAAEPSSYSTQTAGSGTPDDNSANNFIVGRHYTAGNRFFVGRVAKGWHFDKVLSAGERANLQWAGKISDFASCIFYTEYGFQGAADSPDWTGNGFTGTQVGTLTVADHVPLGPTFGIDIDRGVAGAAGQTVAVSQATETDLAQPIAWPPQRLVQRALEVDLAQSITAAKARAIGQALEVDVAQAITVAKAQSIGQALEVDLAQPVAPVGPVLLGQALEVDVAQAVTVAKARAIGQALEVDLAQAITVAKARAIGQALETDLAQPVAPVGPVLLGQALEVDVAQAVTVAKARAIGQALEVDLAQAITVAKARAIGQALETDLAQPVTPSGVLAATVNLALEVDLAQPIAWPPQRLVHQALEVDLAQSITVAKARAIGQALEVDLAQLVAAPIGQLLGQALEIDLSQPVAAPPSRLVARALELDLAQPITATGGQQFFPPAAGFTPQARGEFVPAARATFVPRNQ